MISPSGVSSASPPSLLISTARAFRRFVSCPRRCAIPVSFVGESAQAAKAATVGASSPMLCISSWGIPCSCCGPVAVSPALVRSTWHPIWVRISRIALPGCVVRCGQSAMVTLPPVTAAAARKGVALERSGSISQSWARISPADTRHVLGILVSTVMPCVASISMVMVRCGWLGTASFPT